MYEPNAQRIMQMLGPQDVVLDIGGWARPFNRANWVMDAEPWKTRGYYGRPQGGDREHFTQDTWIQRDICDRTPYPFQDKSIDFVICSHTLEDVRDPLWVCSEMVRIAQRGYVEVPSRLVESCRGVEPDQVGWTHHRWLVDIEGNEIRFLMKYHMIHSHFRFALPESYLRSLPEEKQVQWLFWDGDFRSSERTIHGVDAIARELERFVQQTHPYPAWQLRLDGGLRWARRLAHRALGKARRTVRALRE